MEMAAPMASEPTLHLGVSVIEAVGEIVGILLAVARFAFSESPSPQAHGGLQITWSSRGAGNHASWFHHVLFSSGKPG